MNGDSGVKIVGPFNEYRLVIDGWQVPLIQARELDGGRFFLTLDGRIGLEVDAPHFDKVARFVADVIGTCFGYGAHPSSDEWYEEAGLENPFEDRRAAFAGVPHPTLAPSRLMEIASVQTDEVPDDDEAEEAT